MVSRKKKQLSVQRYLWKQVSVPDCGMFDTATHDNRRLLATLLWGRLVSPPFLLLANINSTMMPFLISVCSWKFIFQSSFKQSSPNAILYVYDKEQVPLMAISRVKSPWIVWSQLMRWRYSTSVARYWLENPLTLKGDTTEPPLQSTKTVINDRWFLWTGKSKKVQVFGKSSYRKMASYDQKLADFSNSVLFTPNVS